MLLPLTMRLRRCPGAGVLPSCPLAIPSDQPDARKRCVPTVHLAAARAGLRFAQTHSRFNCFNCFCCLYCVAACRGYPTGHARIATSGRNEQQLAVRPPWPTAGQFLLRVSGDGCADRYVFRTGRRESLAWPARRLSPVPKHVHLRRGVSGFVNAPSTRAEGTCADV